MRSRNRGYLALPALIALAFAGASGPGVGTSHLPASGSVRLEAERRDAPARGPADAVRSFRLSMS